MPQKTRNRNPRNPAPRQPRLTRAERKKLAELSARVMRDGKRPRSAQDKGGSGQIIIDLYPRLPRLPDDPRTAFLDDEVDPASE